MKNLILLLIVLALGALSWFFMSSKEDQSSNLTWDREFGLDDVSQVSKVFIAYRNGRTVLLEKQDEKDWTFNSQYRARQEVVDRILQFLDEVELYYIPPEAARESILMDIAENGIKVEVYTDRSEPEKVFYVGGTNSSGDGTFLLMEGSTQPYSMTTPAFVGSHRVWFSLKRDDWKDRKIYDIDPEKLEKVQIIYPKQQSRSYTLSKQGSKYVLDHPLEPERPTVDVDKSRVLAYIDDMNGFGAEAFKNNHAKRDSFSTLIPFAIVELCTKTDTISTRYIPIVNKDALTTDIDRLYVDCSWGDFMLVQERVFRDLFLQYDYWAQ